MLGVSEAVKSNQTDVHENLVATVEKHLRHLWQGPIAEHTRLAFEQLTQWRAKKGTELPLVLDTGCGTGRSTFLLAQQYPEALVVGVDQSADRLQRGSRRFKFPENALLLRAESADLWRLMAAHEWRLWRHYVLYPNPWPKSAHLRRRWHGHPAWRELLSLGGILHCRTNWRLYVEEMKTALAVSQISAHIKTIALDKEKAHLALTDFEEKYLLSGHELWQLEVQLPG